LKNVCGKFSMGRDWRISDAGSDRCRDVRTGHQQEPDCDFLGRPYLSLHVVGRQF
jgi:hypothetical protein